MKKLILPLILFSIAFYIIVSSIKKITSIPIYLEKDYIDQRVRQKLSEKGCNIDNPQSFSNLPMWKQPCRRGE